MSDVWFTSDNHWDHARVIEFSKRPFESVEEMNEMMVQNWNAVVKPGDRIYHLGDFSLGSEERAIKFAKRLNGQKYLLFGNHDRKLRKSKEFLSQWIWTKDLDIITVDGQQIVLCHYPFLTWASSHRGAWDLHGHCHGSLTPDAWAHRVDVGVDAWNMSPVSLEEIKVVMKTKTFRPVDHHGKKDEE